MFAYARQIFLTVRIYFFRQYTNRWRGKISCFLMWKQIKDWRIYCCITYHYFHYILLKYSNTDFHSQLFKIKYKIKCKYKNRIFPRSTELILVRMVLFRTI